jgi:CelD/BcsL family acetyltransferase involved in cellulose biosynthesis
MVLISELIERAADEGCATFDLLRGDEPYKYRFGAVDREVRTLTLVRRDARSDACPTRVRAPDELPAGAARRADQRAHLAARPAG